MNRREILIGAGATALGLGLSRFAWGWTASPNAPKRKILMFTRSSGFEHSAIKRKNTETLSFAEQIVTDLGAKNGFDVTCTKDGSVFTPENIAQYDAFFFYTTGDLTQPGNDKQNPPMTAAGKTAFLDAIKSGKGFLGTHSATDTFHTEPDNETERYLAHGNKVDPYIAMIGGEFIHHGAQQESKMRVVDPKFPGLVDLKEGFTLKEEWYSLKDFAPNLHVLLVQETEGMTGTFYQRGPYPATWARMHGQGRVFSTSMGHREDVWTNPIFQSVLLGSIAWAVRNVDADVTPNLTTAAPKYADLPPKPAPKPQKK